MGIGKNPYIDSEQEKNIEIDSKKQLDAIWSTVKVIILPIPSSLFFKLLDVFIRRTATTISVRPSNVDIIQ